MKDGGPAFPSKTLTGASTPLHDIYHPGMSLRDWFAGMALDGVIRLQATSFFAIDPVTIAEKCYEIAGIMLKERELLRREEEK